MNSKSTTNGAPNSAYRLTRFAVRGAGVCIRRPDAPLKRYKQCKQVFAYVCVCVCVCSGSAYVRVCRRKDFIFNRKLIHGSSLTASTALARCPVGQKHALTQTHTHTHTNPYTHAHILYIHTYKAIHTYMYVGAATIALTYA